MSPISPLGNLLLPFLMWPYSSISTNFLHILFQIREEWDYNNRLWQTRIRTISKELQNATEGLQYTIFEFMQTMMDYIEDNFEMVMIPPTPGELTLC